MSDDSSIRYRADSRTKEQFLEDIKNGNAVERDIIERYCNKIGATYTALGNDDGEFKEKSNAIADFLVNGEPLEVKFMRDRKSTFHLKKHHIDSYVKQGAKLLFVINYDKSPQYVIIDPCSVQSNKVIFFWNKLCYKCKTKDFEWKEL